MFGSWDFGEMIFRSSILFFTLLLFTRLMGRKQLSQLTFFNYITGIALGSITGSIVIDQNVNLLNGMTGLIWWSMLTIFSGYIALKFRNLRVLIDGQPVIVIKKGKILEEQLDKLRLNIESLTMMLREKQVFSVSDVWTAVFESNGKLSIELRKEKQPITKKDQNIFTVEPMYIPTELVSDGAIIEKNLQESGLTDDWLIGQLKKQNLKIEDVFFIGLEENGTLYIDERNENRKE